MSTFFFDSYFKLTNLPRESDVLRSKYSNLQDFLRNTIHYSIPFSTEQITDFAPYILISFAVLQALLALLVVLGQRYMSLFLIILSIVQTFVMHNPLYKNSTEIDRQRCYKHIMNEMFMIATLFIVTDMKRAEKTHNHK